MNFHLILFSAQLLLLGGCAKSNYSHYEDLTDNLRQSSMVNINENPSYEVLRDSLSTKELVALTDHSEPVIRAYGFSALADKGYPQPKLEEIFQAHLKDTARISYYIAHVGEPARVVSVMLFRLLDSGYQVPEERLDRYQRVVDNYKDNKYDLF